MAERARRLCSHVVPKEQPLGPRSSPCMASDNVLIGSCNCGAVTYEVQTPVLFTANCWCKDCAQAHGSPVTSVFLQKASKVKITKGQADLKYYDRGVSSVGET